MALNDPRSQLLANLKCLYGSDVDVLTVCVDASYDKYQAVAVRFDPLTASWTKFLHSEPNDTSTRGAIETLLRVSEEELAKLITANGGTLPFQGTVVQNLTLHRGQPRNASSEDTLLSDFVCVATPGPNLLATVPNESGHRDKAVGVPASNDPSVDEVPVAEAAVEDILHESPVESVAISGEIELLCAELEPALEESETFTSRWSSWGTGSKSKKNKKTKKTRFIFDETQPAEEYLADVAAEELVPEEPAPEEPPAEAIVEVEYSTVKACSSYDMTEEVAASHHQPDPSPPENDISFRAFNGTEEETKKKSINLTQAPDIAPAPQPAEDFGRDSYSASTKKKFGKLIEQESLDPPEDVPVLKPAGATEPPDDLNWGSCWASNNNNNKKKKGTKLLAPPEDEPLPEPSFPTEALDDLWDSFSTSKKGNKKYKKKGTKLIEEESLAPPEDEPLPEPSFPTKAPDDLWGFFPISKKKKKGTKLIEESLAPPELEPALELAVAAKPPNDLWGSFSTSKKKQQKKKGKTFNEEQNSPPPDLELVLAAEDEFEESKLDVPAQHGSPSAPLTSPSEPQPVTENALHETLRSETPLQPQNVGHFRPALLLSAKASTDTDTITNNLQAQVLPSRRTVVVTIQFPNEISSKPQHVMTTVADNTRAAIFDAVNSYLDSKNVMKRMQGQRELEIKCGVGRDGDVDLSTVEETMWPEYLDYFRQYTRIPELTVQVIGC